MFSIYSCCFRSFYYFRLLMANTKLYYILSLLLLVLNLKAQKTFLLLDKQESVRYESVIIADVDSFHSAVFPHILPLASYYDTLNLSLKENINSSFGNKILNDKLLYIDKLKTHIYPVLNLSYAKDFSTSLSPHLWSSGVAIEGSGYKKWYWKAALWGALQSFDLYQQRFVDSTGFLPQGSYNAKLANGYSFVNYNAYLLYEASPYIYFQFGKGRNFWGDGYRSLLLSDNAAAYPYLKVMVNVWKIQYVILYQFLEDINENHLLEKKYVASHFMSWNIGKRFNINMFESVIFRNNMPNGGSRGFDINYWNPIIFFRPVEFSIGSPDNVIMGSGFRWRWFKNMHWYGQFVLDEFKLKEWLDNKNWWANKIGYQLGCKLYNSFGIRDLTLRAEYNTVRPYTYSHRSSMENYGYMYQPLAHPYGANFKELLATVLYQKKRWSFFTKLSFAKIGMDKDGLDYGQNIYRSYLDAPNVYGNLLLQGDLTHLNEWETKVRYLLNPNWHLSVELGFQFLSYTNSQENIQQTQVFLGLKTLF